MILDNIIINIKILLRDSNGKEAKTIPKRPNFERKQKIRKPNSDLFDKFSTSTGCINEYSLINQ